ncbi:hypothetical protein [Clostridium tertium]|jgi:DNA repair exonuclease SbcCD ATPase subunit
MRVSKNIVISIAITLVAGVGISSLIFKPMGTVATERNNSELYYQMKEEAKIEAQEEFDIKLQEEIKKIKEDTDLQMKNLKAEYDSAIADAKLQQANELQAAINQANSNAQQAINEATSPEAIEKRRQEEMKKNPIEIPETKPTAPAEPPKHEPQSANP